MKFFQERYINQIGLYAAIIYSVLRVIEVTYVRAPMPWLFYALLFLFLIGVFYWGRAFLAHEVIASKGLIIGLFLLLSMAGAFGLQLVFFNENFDQDGRSSTEYTRGILLTAYLWFFAGSAGSISNIKRSYYLPVLIVVSCLILSFRVLDGGYLIDYTLLQSLSTFDDLNHLYLAEYMVFIGFAAYALTPLSMKPVIFFCVSFLVFICGGRASFFISLGVFVVYEFLYGNRRLLRFYLALASLAGVAIASLLNFSDPLVRRMFFSDGFVADASRFDRSLYVLDGISNLDRQLLIGNPSLISEMFGSLGAYAHNLLSVWQFFGLGVFLLVVLALIHSLMKMHDALKVHMARPSVEFGALILLYSFVSVVTSKYVGFYFLWYSIGFWCFFLSSKNPEFARH